MQYLKCLEGRPNLYGRDFFFFFLEKKIIIRLKKEEEFPRLCIWILYVTKVKIPFRRGQTPEIKYWNKNLYKPGVVLELLINSDIYIYIYSISIWYLYCNSSWSLAEHYLQCVNETVMMVTNPQLDVLPLMNKSFNSFITFLFSLAAGRAYLPVLSRKYNQSINKDIVSSTFCIQLECFRPLFQEEKFSIDILKDESESIRTSIGWGPFPRGGSGTKHANLGGPDGQGQKQASQARPFLNHLNLAQLHSS